MPKNSKYIFHIGMPKTATSYLQKNFYPNLNLHYLGKHYDSKTKDKDFAKIFSELFSTQAFADTDRLYRDIKSKMPDSSIILYSNELMSGTSRINFLNSFQISYHLKECFENPKIIFVIRKQDSFIESIYRQAIRGGYSGSLKSFINYKRGKFNKSTPGKGGWMDIYSLDYFRWAEHYRELFKEDNILILPYEKLKSNRDEFLKDIADFIGVEYIKPKKSEQTNKADSYLLLNMMRISNMCLSKRVQNRINDILFIDKLFSLLNYIPFEKKFLSKEFAKDIMEFHSSSNKQLSKKYDLSLDKYGYF